MLEILIALQIRALPIIIPFFYILLFQQEVSLALQRA